MPEGDSGRPAIKRMGDAEPGRRLRCWRGLGRRHRRRRLPVVRPRAGNPAAAPAALADGAVAPARGAQAGRDLPGGAGGPASAARRGVVDLPAVARPGAVLRHALRGQHQAVLVSRRAATCFSRLHRRRRSSAVGPRCRR